MRFSDRELYKCKDCRVFDPDNQPSTKRALERNPHVYDNKLIVIVRTGRNLFGMPVMVQMMLCSKHEKAERG